MWDEAIRIGIWGFKAIIWMKIIGFALGLILFVIICISMLFD